MVDGKYLDCREENLTSYPSAVCPTIQCNCLTGQRLS
jgi:hypothetical protein